MPAMTPTAKIDRSSTVLILLPDMTLKQLPIERIRSMAVMAILLFFILDWVFDIRYKSRYTNLRFVADKTNMVFISGRTLILFFLYYL